MPDARKPNDDAARFGGIIYSLRTKRGWPRSKLAQRAGVSKEYLRKIEWGANTPTLPVVLSLIEVLEADPAVVMRQLIDGRNTPRKAKAAAPAGDSGGESGS